MGADLAKAIIIVTLMAVTAGCATSRDYDRAFHGCVRCSLPEKIEPGRALIYVVRGAYFGNQYDENNLYVEAGSARQFFGTTIDNTYCSVNVPPGRVTLIVETTPKAEGLLNRAQGSTLTLDVSAHQEHFVLLDFKLGLITSSSTLKSIDAATGRKLLAGVQGKCYEKPYAERRAEALKEKLH